MGLIHTLLAPVTVLTLPRRALPLTQNLRENHPRGTGTGGVFKSCTGRAVLSTFTMALPRLAKAREMVNLRGSSKGGLCSFLSAKLLALGLMGLDLYTLEPRSTFWRRHGICWYKIFPGMTFPGIVDYG